MEVGRAIFLAVAISTHGVVGYAVVRGFTTLDPRAGFVLGIVPDVDLLFPPAWGWPFVHRGLTHSPAFLAAAVASAYAVARRREVAVAVGAALGSHLVIDALSPGGIPWLVPVAGPASAVADALSVAGAGSEVAANAPSGLPVHGLYGTVLLWSFSLALLWWRSDRSP